MKDAGRHGREGGPREKEKRESRCWRSESDRPKGDLQPRSEISTLFSFYPANPRTLTAAPCASVHTRTNAHKRTHNQHYAVAASSWHLTKVHPLRVAMATGRFVVATHKARLPGGGGGVGGWGGGGVGDKTANQTLEWNYVSIAPLKKTASKSFQW